MKIQIIQSTSNIGEGMEFEFETPFVIGDHIEIQGHSVGIGFIKKIGSGAYKAGNPSIMFVYKVIEE